MFKRTNKFRDNVSVMYKSVDDLILKNKGLVGRTRLTNSYRIPKSYFTRC